MEKPTTMHGWLREAMSFYNRSLRDHIDEYYRDRKMFFWIQHQFAPRYAFEARSEEPTAEKVKQVEGQVFYWFGSLPEKHDDVANECDFAFVFCYLCANIVLGYIERDTAWDALGYMTRHWGEFEEMTEVPKEIS